VVEVPGASSTVELLLVDLNVRRTRCVGPPAAARSIWWPPAYTIQQHRHEAVFAQARLRMARPSPSPPPTIAGSKLAVIHPPDLERRQTTFPTTTAASSLSNPWSVVMELLRTAELIYSPRCVGPAARNAALQQIPRKVKTNFPNRNNSLHFFLTYPMIFIEWIIAHMSLLSNSNSSCVNGQLMSYLRSRQNDIIVGIIS
jgi:hypothetical protein